MSKQEPEVIRGLPVEQAMAQLVASLSEAMTGDPKASPLDLDRFCNIDSHRTLLDTYLEQRLLDVLNPGGFVVLARGDMVESLNERIRNSRDGQVDLEDRLEIGSQRSARILVRGQTAAMASHVELFLQMYDVEHATQMLQRRVELAWNADLREMSRRRIITPDQAGTLTAGSGALANQNVVVEGGPISLSFKLIPFEPTTRAGMRQRIQPLRDGGSLRTDDGFALEFEPSRDCHVYAFVTSSDGSSNVIFPHSQIDLGTRVKGHKRYRLPERECYQLDDVVGTETVYLVASDERLPDLESIAKSLSSPSDATGPGIARQLVEQMKTLKSGSGLTRKYVAVPGSKGIRTELAPVSDAPSPASDMFRQDQAVETLESLGCVVETIRFQHR